MLTKKQMQLMKEDQLRKEVLIPLLSAMGFQDVKESHGSGELGKDIVFWKQDELGTRRR